MSLKWIVVITINDKDPVVLDEMESLLHEQNMPYWINSIFIQYTFCKRLVQVSNDIILPKAF